jgi:polysaccharide biosynthesis/export protein
LERQGVVLKPFSFLSTHPGKALALCSTLLWLSACTTDPALPINTAASKMTPFYRIGPGDQLSIFVYGSPDLSVNALPVGPDGRISIPLVPNIVAENKTTTELQTEISHDLEKYIKPPISVTVMVNSFHGPLASQIRVIGNSTKPTSIPYETGMTLLDVMTAVGGLNEYADGNSAYIDRSQNGHETKIPVRIGALLNRGEVSQNLPMHPGDIVIIPSTWF